MSSKTKKDTKQKRWLRIVDMVGDELPNLASWLGEEEEFIELRIKAREDGSTLAIAKGYSGTGMPVVCFGVAYGPYLALMAIDASIQGGNWREDKPWPGGSNG